MPKVTATNKEGNFQVALAAAVELAYDSINVADGTIEWKLDQVSGLQGTVAGLKEINVTIEFTQKEPQ